MEGFGAGNTTGQNRNRNRPSGNTRRNTTCHVAAASTRNLAGHVQVQIAHRVPIELEHVCSFVKGCMVKGRCMRRELAPRRVPACSLHRTQLPAHRPAPSKGPTFAVHARPAQTSNAPADAARWQAPAAQLPAGAGRKCSLPAGEPEEVHCITAHVQLASGQFPLLQRFERACQPPAGDSVAARRAFGGATSGGRSVLAHA